MSIHTICQLSAIILEKWYKISIARDLLSGFTIALIIHSLDPSLSTQLIVIHSLDRSAHPSNVLEERNS